MSLSMKPATPMNKTEAVPAAEFIRNFGRYRMLAQKQAVPVTSHGHITGYFVPADEYEAFARYQVQRRSFATRELSDEKVRAITTSRMDERHDHLNTILDGT